MTIRLRVPRPRIDLWLAALYSARWGVALGLLYAVGAPFVALLLAVSELEATAALGDALVRAVPYWRSP